MDILFSLVFTGFGFAMIWRSIKLKREGIFTIGTVTKAYYSKRRGVRVRFKTLHNKRVEFNAGGSSYMHFSSGYQVGSQVPVLYNRHNSKEAIIYNVDFMWYIPIGLTITGIILLYFSIIN